ncbi:HAD-IA family hydrolase [Pseudonocardia acaciae]|uniref:HAD-IA family hydrolase n=1 Tax=Pseudonocardia acaciae TaxID=551276 RepID=UPI000684112F|nr:HAD-IA family hydrolase [Pseudonocardia acaciae]
MATADPRTGIRPPYDAVIFDLDGVIADLGSADGPRVLPGAAALTRRLKRSGIALGLVTGARDTATLLRAEGLDQTFDAVVDRAAFPEAARRLGVAPERTAVVEDSAAGIAEARRLGFGLVVGIDRVTARDDLESAGADFVLSDVAELDLGARRVDPWLLVYEGFDPAREAHREALTTLGNGYLATRGALPEHRDDGVHYPGTYLAGVYNRLTSTVEGRPREDEELVNAPNWLPFDLRVEDGRWWSEGGLRVEWDRRELDLRRGILTRTARLAAGDGRALRVTQRRLVSMDRPHLAAMQVTVAAEGWSGTVGVRTGIDPNVVNGNAVESRLLANRHLVPLGTEQLDDTLVTEVRTSQSKVRIATAARTRCRDPHTAGALEDDGAGRAMARLDIPLADRRPVTVERTIAVVTSRDSAIASPRDAALEELRRADDPFDRLAERHAAAWRRLWDRFAIELDAHNQVRLVVNLHLFHMLQAISPHTESLDAGVPARGLHGEGYRGHVFWDELFVLPVYATRLPSVARALLDYRWRRLDAARDAARRAGLHGAMFPWQSGSDGREETPHRLYNPRSGRWMPDNSRRQRHVGLAVAWAAWQHYQATGDTAWFAARGAELVIEVTRLFAAMAGHEPADDRYHIAGVLGPDEYHDGYPDAPGEGLRDNAYTNVLTAWLCRRAMETLSILPAHERDDLVARLDIHPDEPGHWMRLGRRLAVPFHDGVISQFDGYHRLAELDWERYRRRYGNIGRLDLILEAEGDSPNNYRLSKQADVLMLLYLLGPDELTTLLAELGYPFTDADLARTVAYYLARTAHGSTLSRVVHTSVLARLDPSTAWNEFREALDADLDDTQGGTTGRGIHLGAMAGTIDILTRTFAGIRMDNGTLLFAPRPPGGLRRATATLSYRGQRITIALDRHALRLTAEPSATPPVRVQVDRISARLGGGETLEFPLTGDS